MSIIHPGLYKSVADFHSMKHISPYRYMHLRQCLYKLHKCTIVLHIILIPYIEIDIS